MIKEYPDEGFDEVVIPPLSQLDGDLKKANEDLRHITFIVPILPPSSTITVVILVPSSRQSSPFFDMSVSSIQWFFNNVVDEDEGLHRLVLEHSRFDNDGPFLTAAQHAGFAAPPEGLLEPPLHCRMLALSTAFPHRDGAGRWDNEQLMLEYIHHITYNPMSVPVPSDEPTSAVGEGVPSSPIPSRVPLFLPEQESPTSPSPPPPSPSLPPLFGSVANLAIDLTGGDDDLYEPEDSHCTRGSEADGMEVAPLSDVLKEEPL
ncbi:hypothetical protein F5877DRAFT_78735 [Lentinula edodes]|nr:hypothetical protein F5877DRAFT_78735 [Lentinula edodes]